jgi:hypothetical protein
MKRIFVIVLVFMSYGMHSQGIDFGIKAGVNFSTLSDAAAFDNKAGFVGGIFAGINFNDKWGIRADALYSKQGAKVTGGDFDLSYLNIPVVIKRRLFSKLHLQVGPQFGFQLDKKTIIPDFDSIDTKKFDLSGIVGLGLDVPLGLRLEARYVFGLSDVSDIVDFDNGKNRVFTILLGYSFL